MKPPQGAQAAAIAVALHAAVDAAKDASTVLLLGPYAGEIGPSDGIAIAPSDGTSSGIVVQRQRESDWGRSYREEVTIICSAWSWTGDTNMQPRIERCGALLTLVYEVAAEDPTLGGLCDQLNIDDRQEWIPSQNPTGASCAVGFAVTATLTGA